MNIWFKKYELRDMTITQLSTFLKITETNSFSAAAGSLGYAQSTVTTQIKQLEDELGCVLFERLGKTISITASGERLIGYAEKMLQLERDIRLDVTDEENPAGVLKLGVSESLCISRFPRILMEYNKNNPRTEIRIQFVTHENIPELLQKGELDMVYTLNPLIDNTELKMIHKRKETLTFFASPDHPITKKKKVNEKDLEGIPLLLTSHNCSFRHMLLQDFMDHQVTPKIELETSSKEILKQFAINGLGIAFMPTMVATEEVKNGLLKKIDWAGADFPVFSQLFIHKDKHVSKAMDELIRRIIDESCSKEA